MFCWHKHKTGDIEKYKVNGVLMQMTSPVYFCLTYDKKTFVSLCNGVGSRVGWFNKLIYHTIPDSIGILNITGCSDLHDVGFSLPETFATLDMAYRYFCQVNLDFRANLRRRINFKTCWRWIRKTRIFIAKKYYIAVQSSIGWISFIDGKLINGKKVSKEEAKEFYQQINQKREE